MHVSPHLVVGLGNPGPRYEGTRHNAGAMVVAEGLVGGTPGPVPWREKWSSKVAAGTVEGRKIVALLPQTYMNRSGIAVRRAAQFYRVPVERIVVVHDELDFPFGRVAVKAGGGHGGHNGLRDIIAHLGTRAFVRVRVGIGRPPAGGDVTAYVLSAFSAVERAELPAILNRGWQAVEAVVARGVSAAMNEFNRT